MPQFLVVFFFTLKGDKNQISAVDEGNTGPGVINSFN